MSPVALLAVAAGGAIGATARYVLGGAAQAMARGSIAGMPVGTLVVNVVGSALMGILYVLLVERAGVGESWRLFALTGVLGGFTTFSAFSIETLMLLQQGAGLRAAAYVLASVTLCVLAAWLGVEISRQL